MLLMVHSMAMLREITGLLGRVLRITFGGCLIAGGAVWLGYLTWTMYQLMFDLVPSADVARTYFFIDASTGVMAIFAITLGCWLIWPVYFSIQNGRFKVHR